ncbi:MAG: Spy/CpxP family protein refolding chaperone [Pirellulales bacterium]
MRKLGKPLLILVAIAIFCGAALQGEAQDRKKKNAKKAAKAPDPLAKMLANIDLTAEQQAQVGELKKEYGPKLAALQKRRSEVMTPDRRKAEKEAKKAAKDAGKKGKEAKAAVEEVLGLSPAERERLATIQKEQQALRAELMEQARALLTPEQKAKLPEPAKKKKKAQKKDRR